MGTETRYPAESRFNVDQRKPVMKRAKRTELGKDESRFNVEQRNSAGWRHGQYLVSAAMSFRTK